MERSVKITDRNTRKGCAESIRAVRRTNGSDNGFGPSAGHICEMQRAVGECGVQPPEQPNMYVTRSGPKRSRGGPMKRRPASAENIC